MTTIHATNHSFGRYQSIDISNCHGGRQTTRKRQNICCKNINKNRRRFKLKSWILADAARSKQKAAMQKEQKVYRGMRVAGASFLPCCMQIKHKCSVSEMHCGDVATNEQQYFANTLTRVHICYLRTHTYIHVSCRSSHKFNVRWLNDTIVCATFCCNCCILFLLLQQLMLLMLLLPRAAISVIFICSQFSGIMLQQPQ